jgi:hypothetical protein
MYETPWRGLEIRLWSCGGGAVDVVRGGTRLDGCCGCRGSDSGSMPTQGW